MFKVIIAGGRNFNNYQILKEKCIFYLKDRIKDEICIVSGCANGADKLGEKFAEEFRIDVELYPAQWNTLGKRAGYIRNEEMANNANALIAFWDGESNGTRHMIETAKKKGLLVRVILYENKTP